MGDRNREFLSFVVDVGPGMHGLLPHVEEYLMCSVEAKIANKAKDEVAVLLYGSTDTKNEPHEEAKSQGDPDQYTHVSVLINYTLPSMDTLRACKSMPRGTGEHSDVLNALTVANDMLVKCANDRLLGPKVQRRVVLISSLRNKGLGWDKEFTSQMAGSLRGHGVQLEVLHLDFAPPTPAADGTEAAEGAGGHELVSAAPTLTPEQQQVLDENLDGLTHLLQELGSSTGIQRVRSPADLARCLRWVEVTPTTTFRGPLSIGKDLRIPVRVYKKVSRQGVPSLKSYVPAPPGVAAVGFTHAAIRGTEYRVEGEPDTRVEEADTVRGHRYGRQLIPIDASVEAMMKFSVPDKELSLWGFMPKDQVKRFALMGEALVVVPEPDAQGAGQAVSALVRAMQELGQVAVARYVARANSRPTLLLLTPRLGTLHRPDSWVANTLPFEQDLKWVDFPQLGRGIPLPQEQVDAACALVDSMQLSGSGPTAPVGTLQQPTASAPLPAGELLVPERTPNPVLRRFYLTAARKALNDTQGDADADEGDDQGAVQVPPAEEDDLVHAVFDTPHQLLAAAQAARERMSQVFKTRVVATAATADADQGALQHVFGGDMEEGGGPVVVPQAGGEQPPGTVGTATPLDDFNALLAADKAKDAVLGMRGVILQLVDESVGPRNYDKAAACVAALRSACITHRLPADFNEHLQGLANRFKSDPAHAAFFARLVSAKVAPISQGEAPGAEGAMPQAEVDAWLQAHASTATAAPAAAADAAEEDEFADME